MKIAKRIFLTFLVLFIFLFLLRGWLYRHSFSYKAIEERPAYVATSPHLIEMIEESSDIPASDPEMIIDRSLAITSFILKFKGGKRDVDPNKLINTKNAHCVGYAAFFTTVCNKMFELNDLSDQWIATPHKGELYFMGVNIHPYFKSAFFRDHDFVIIKNLKSGGELAVDPTLHDYTGIRYISLRK